MLRIALHAPLKTAGFKSVVFASLYCFNLTNEHSPRGRPSLYIRSRDSFEIIVLLSCVKCMQTISTIVGELKLRVMWGKCKHVQNASVSDEYVSLAV